MENNQPTRDKQPELVEILTQLRHQNKRLDDYASQIFDKVNLIYRPEIEKGSVMAGNPIDKPEEPQ